MLGGEREVVWGNGVRKTITKTKRQTFKGEKKGGLLKEKRRPKPCSCISSAKRGRVVLERGNRRRGKEQERKFECGHPTWGGGGKGARFLPQGEQGAIVSGVGWLNSGGNKLHRSPNRERTKPLTKSYRQGESQGTHLPKDITQIKKGSFHREKGKNF